MKTSYCRVFLRWGYSEEKFENNSRINGKERGKPKLQDLKLKLYPSPSWRSDNFLLLHYYQNFILLSATLADTFFQAPGNFRVF